MECVQAECDTQFAQISCHTIRVALSWHRLHVQARKEDTPTCQLDLCVWLLFVPKQCTYVYAFILQNCCNVTSCAISAVDPVGRSPARCHDMHSNACASKCMSLHRAGELPMSSVIFLVSLLWQKKEIDNINSKQRQIAAMALHGRGCMDMHPRKAS